MKGTPTHTTQRSHSSSSDAIKAGVGRNSGSSTLAPFPSASALLSSFRSLRSRSSHSDASLCASSSSGAGTRLPTSVVDRKSSTALLHVSSARRSRTFQQLFTRPSYVSLSRPDGIVTLVGRSAGLQMCDRWECAEIICDFIQMRLRTTAYMHSSPPYHPHEAPIFPVRQKKMRKTK
jgi:hypothetical protein